MCPLVYFFSSNEYSNLRLGQTKGKELIKDTNHILDTKSNSEVFRNTPSLTFVLHEYFQFHFMGTARCLLIYYCLRAIILDFYIRSICLAKIVKKIKNITELLRKLES